MSFLAKLANLCEDSAMAETGFAQSVLEKSLPNSKPLSVGSRHLLTENGRLSVGY